MPTGPLSLTDGLRRCFGKPELLARLLRLFVDEQRDVAAAIEQAVRDGDAARAIVLAHGLVSRAGAIGASSLSRQASELEDVLRDADSPGLVPARVAALLEEHARVLRAAIEHMDASG